MVSEAKKPLVASMVYLVIYLVIILAVTTYIVVGGIKGIQDKKGDTGGANKDTVTPSQGKQGGGFKGKGLGLFKKGINTLVASGRFTTPKEYKTTHDIINKGSYLEPKPQTFLDRFLLEYYVKVAQEEDKSESKEEMTAVEMSRDPSSHLRFFKLKNTFGVSGSDGYFNYYNRNVELLRKTLDLTNFDNFVEKEKFKIIMNHIEESTSGATYHVKVVLDQTVQKYDPSVFSVANIDTLSDYLITSEKSLELEHILRLSIPSGFGLFVGKKPTVVSVPSDPDIKPFRDIFISTKKLVQIENLFKEKELKAFFYGNKSIELTKKNFESIQAYWKSIKAKNFKFIDNVIIFLSVDEGKEVKLTCHLAAESEEVLKDLRIKADDFVAAIFDKTLTSSINHPVGGMDSKFLNFNMKMDFCILFQFDGNGSSEFEKLFFLDDAEESEETLLHKVIKSKTFNYDVAIKKYDNYRKLKGITVYEFSFAIENVPIEDNSVNYESEKYNVKMTGANYIKEADRREILRDLTAVLSKNDTLASTWSDICTKEQYHKSFKIIITQK